MKNKYLQTILVLVISLILATCGSSESNDVPSLEATPTPDTVVETLDDEALLMNFTECLRNEGLQVTDPTVDAAGNIQLPELAEGETVTRKEWGEIMKVCGHHIEGLTFGREEVNNSELLEEYLPIATCLNEKGYDVGEPTVETIELWMEDFRVQFDWDNPDALADFEECKSSQK